ncbi:MAG: energy transducer TonB [Bacteroidota bacterium]
MKTFLTLIIFLFTLNLTVAENSSVTFKPGEEDYLAIAEVMPEPANGLPALMKKINYPTIARKAGIEGRVIAMVYVGENGDVENVKIIKGLEAGCSEEVERVLRESKFKPGSNQGKAVKVKMAMAFQFKLQ